LGRTNREPLSQDSLRIGYGIDPAKHFIITRIKWAPFSNGNLPGEAGLDAAKDHALRSKCVRLVRPESGDAAIRSTLNAFETGSLVNCLEVRIQAFERRLLARKSTTGIMPVGPRIRARSLGDIRSVSTSIPEDRPVLSLRMAEEELQQSAVGQRFRQTSSIVDPAFPVSAIFHRKITQRRTRSVEAR